MQVHLDIDLDPSSLLLFADDLPEQQLPGIHKPGEDHVVLLRDIAYFDAVRVLNYDRLLVVGIVGFPEKVEPVVDLQMRLQLVDAFDMAGSRDIGVKQKDVPLEGLRNRNFPPWL